MSSRPKAAALGVTIAIGIAISSDCSADNGIYVGAPKPFDDFFLRSQLDAIQKRLAAIKAIDTEGFTKGLGAVSGTTLQQSSTTIQATARPTPKIVTDIPAQQGASNSPNSQQTTQDAQTTQSAIPGATGLSLPSPIAVSAVDLLNEALQLSYEISNISLLLNGSLSDRFLSPNVAKQRVTLGIPVTIDAPRFAHDNDVAEVQVTVCTRPDGGPPLAQAPSVIAVLPRENTYNVATLTDTSVGLGVGAIAGVFSINAGWLGGKKTYYLVKQQDTVAMQKDPAEGPPCAFGVPHSATVAWQFYPAAGTKYVRSGMRQMFLQLALPNAKRDDNGNPKTVSVDVGIRTLWRRHVWASHAVSADADDQAPETKVHVPVPDTTPYATRFAVKDVGSGNLLVRASGTFLQGLRARVGSNYFNESTPGFFAGEEVLQFMASGQAIATAGTSLVAPDGTEGELVYYNPDLELKQDEQLNVSFTKLFDWNNAIKSAPTNALSDHLFGPAGTLIFRPDPPDVLDCAEHSNEPTSTIVAKRVNYFRTAPSNPLGAELIRRNPFYVNKRLKIDSITRQRFSPDSWLVQVELTEIASRSDYTFQVCNGLPLVLTLNGKLYGLSDAPYFRRQAVPLKLDEEKVDPRSAAALRRFDLYQIKYQLQVVAPDELLSSQPRIKVQRLFMGRSFETDATYFVPPMLSAQKLTALSQGQSNVWILSGSGLSDDVRLLYPAPSGNRIKLEPLTRASALLTIDKAAAPGLKQVVLVNDFGDPAKKEVVTIELPKDSDEAKPETPAVALEADPVQVGSTQVVASGTALDQVQLIRYLRTPLNIVLASEGKDTRIIVDLPAAATATPGTRFLDVTDAAGKHSRLKLVVEAPKTTGRK